MRTQQVGSTLRIAMAVAVAVALHLLPTVTEDKKANGTLGNNFQELEGR
jgi:hypothetical protein